MTQQRMPEPEPCADMEPHPEHSWGHRKRCKGVDITAGIDYHGLERLAALHHDYMRQWIVDRLGSSAIPKWGGLNPVAKKARITAMREVINDLKAART